MKRASWIASLIATRFRHVGSPNKSDPHNLQRFVDAQNPVIEEVCAELREGHKEGHWMWFIFPQIKGLGRSRLANKFAIASREEAKAYLEHPILGPRLRECSRLVLLVEERSIKEIFGYTDSLRSSMTLFCHAAADNRIFKDVLKKHFRGEFDRLTLERL